MKATVSGSDVPAIMAAFAKLDAFKDEPTEIKLDDKEMPTGTDWRASSAKQVWIQWGDDAMLWKTPERVLADHPQLAGDLPAFARWLAKVPFEIASIDSPFRDDWAGYRGPGFGDRHIALGWAVMFKGAGHDRLVSRRWLDQPMWKLTDLGGDTSLVEFHSLDADAATALAQAKVGHERMGITDTGGYMQPTWPIKSKLDGVYDAKEKAFKVPVAARTLEQREMLDLCVYRRDHRDDAAKPIELAGFVFVIGPDEAQPYLEELWLRELGCWAIVRGNETRLDTDFTPPKHPPAW